MSEDYSNLVGKKVTFGIKPTLMRDWIVVRETAKCLVLKKPGDKMERCYLPKKIITQVVKVEENEILH